MSSLLDCFYEYLRQPPTELDCNPYNGVRVECEVLAPVRVGVEVEIQWFYNDEQIMLDSFPVGTEITDEVDEENEDIRTSTLVFTSEFTDTYRGNYHCQIVVNGNFTAPSQSLSLIDEEPYIILPTQFCPVQAVDVSKCAWRATIAPPSPSTTTQPDNSSTTTDPGTPPPTTSGSETQNTSTDNNTVDTTMEVESPTSVESDTMVWLIMLLVFVVGTVMIILIIGVLVCCLRKKLKNGTKGGI